MGSHVIVPPLPRYDRDRDGSLYGPVDGGLLCEAKDVDVLEQAYQQRGEEIASRDAEIARLRDALNGCAIEWRDADTLHCVLCLRHWQPKLDKERHAPGCIAALAAEEKL